MSALSLQQAMVELPLVAILRGVRPDEVLSIGKAIYDAGFRVIEVPLNSHLPYESIKLLSEKFGQEVVIGAGTVLNVQQVDQVHAAGGRIIISPNVNLTVISESKQRGLYAVPGFYTPSEAFAAIDVGADALKMFPADTLGVKGLKAMSAVLPSISVLPVGGITANAQLMSDYFKVGAKGFGLGSGLYKAGMSVDQVAQNALAYVSAYHQAIEK